MDMSGKVALVTGAGRGFGWGIARALARAGTQVAVTDINNGDITRAVQDIERDGGEAIGYYLDTAESEQFYERVAEILDRWGRIDVLVHCAIYMPLRRFEDTLPQDWWHQLQVGLGGLYHGTRAVWGAMAQQGGGHIIGIASGSSVRGYKDEVAYCTIKHAQEGFAKALALEAWGHNIAVNTVGPGKPIKTTRITWTELEAMPSEEKSQWADPIELGRALVWLASQTPQRFTGLRFDAGPIVDTLNAEGADFVFTPEKVTLYVDDFKQRREWYRNYDNGSE